MRSVVTLSLLLVVVSLGLPARAGAVAVAPGATDPKVVMAPDGTAFVAAVSGDEKSLTLCRLPYGATACDALAPPPVPDRVVEPGDDFAANIDTIELLRRPADGALVLVSSTFDIDGSSVDDDARQIFATVSPDNGATWSPQVQIGSGQGVMKQASLTPDGAAVDVIGDRPSSAQYSRLPLAGPATPPARDLNPTPDEIVTHPTITTQADGTVIAGFRAGGGVQSRFGLARLPAGADPVTGWTPWRRAGRILAQEIEQRLVTGPRGTFLLARRDIIRQIRARYRPLFFRRVTPTRVAKGIVIGRGFTNVGVALAQDTLGGQHVAYFNSAGSRDGLYYLRTRGPRGRCSFGAQTRLVRISYSDLAGAPQLAAATPQRAILVYGTEAGVDAVWTRGGDRPRLSRRAARRC